MDKIFKGITAGIIAAVIMNLINLILFYNFHLIKIRFLDWAGLIMLGSLPQSKAAIIYSLLIHICWTGTLGIIFNYILIQISHQAVIIKGGLYAFLLTFIFRSLAVLFQMQTLANSNLTTSIANTLTSLTWGLILGALLYIFNND